MAESIPLPQYIKGMVREAVVDSPVAPADSLELSMNLHFDIIGAVSLRKGMTLLGSQVRDNYNVLGMHTHINNAGTTRHILAKVGDALYPFTGSAWQTAIRTGLVAGSKMRYTTFVDYTFMVNGSGSNGDDIKSYNGSIGTTNCASLPKGDDIENYRSRLWVLDSSTDKVYYSDVVNTDNTITGGAEFIQISPQDGDKAVALKRSPNALLVFKQNHIYRIQNINTVDPDPKIYRGTYSKDSIIESKIGIHFHHSSGFYTYNDGGQPTELSKPIYDFVKAIPRANYENVTGWADDDHLNWSVGDLTVGGIAFTNVVFNYTISTELWTIYSMGSEIKSACAYDNGTDQFLLVGDDDGNVLKWGVGDTDNGTAIFYDLQTHWLYLPQNKSSITALSELATLHENAQGSNVQWQFNNASSFEWKGGGTIKKDLVDTFPINAKNIIRIRLRLHGQSKGTGFLFRGWELLNAVVNGPQPTK